MQFIPGDERWELKTHNPEVELFLRTHIEGPDNEAARRAVVEAVTEKGSSDTHREVSVRRVRSELEFAELAFKADGNIAVGPGPFESIPQWLSLGNVIADTVGGLVLGTELWIYGVAVGTAVILTFPAISVATMIATALELAVVVPTGLALGLLAHAARDHYRERTLARAKSVDFWNNSQDKFTEIEAELQAEKREKAFAQTMANMAGLPPEQVHGIVVGNTGALVEGVEFFRGNPKAPLPGFETQPADLSEDGIEQTLQIARSHLTPSLQQAYDAVMERIIGDFNIHDKYLAHAISKVAVCAAWQLRDVPARAQQVALERIMRHEAAQAGLAALENKRGKRHENRRKHLQDIGDRALQEIKELASDIQETRQLIHTEADDALGQIDSFAALSQDMQDRLANPYFSDRNVTEILYAAGLSSEQIRTFYGTLRNGNAPEYTSRHGIGRSILNAARDAVYAHVRFNLQPPEARNEANQRYLLAIQVLQDAAARANPLFDFPRNIISLGDSPIQTTPA